MIPDEESKKNNSVFCELWFIIASFIVVIETFRGLART